MIDTMSNLGSSSCELSSSQVDASFEGKTSGISEV